jgi:FlaA1/EpsC-like NDP-sugar epimerase
LIYFGVVVNTDALTHRTGFRPLGRPAVRFSLVFFFDAAIAVVSLWTAMFLRFDGHVEEAYWSLLPTYTVVLVASRFAANLLLRLHRWSFRLSGLHDGARVGVAAAAGTGTFILALYLLRVLSPPRSVVVLELLASAAGMLALRFMPRLGWTYLVQFDRARRGNGRRTLIIGAGAAGEMLFRDLQRSTDHPFQVVGFIDDDPAVWSSLLGGRRVLGGLAALPQLIEELRVTTLLIAIPRRSPAVVREVVAICAGLNVQIKVLPVSYTDFQERGAASMLHDLAPEHLLARQPVTFSEHERSVLADRRVLVTGAAGSIGSEICEQLLSLGVNQLLGVDINENGLYLLERRLRKRHDGRLRVDVVDIRDRARVETVMARFAPHDVFHAAAHKHVPLMEAAPAEAIKNNVGGTANVLLAAEKLGVERFVFISSDKAVAPSSVMGATKRVGELMTRAVARRANLQGCAVRFGNVLGSDGSVVPLFRQQIEAGGPVTLTHPDVRRYFMTIPEAVGLVVKAAYGNFGELCVLDMGEPVRIADLARQMISMAGLVPDVDIQIEVTGLRPGEKLNEELMMEDEEVTSSVGDKIQVITGPPPPPHLWHLLAELGHAAVAEDELRVRALLKTIVPTYQSSLKPSIVTVASRSDSDAAACG